MENRVYHWLMCDVPKLDFPRNGFRKSRDGFKSYLKSILKGSIIGNLLHIIHIEFPVKSSNRALIFPQFTTRLAVISILYNVYRT